MKKNMLFIMIILSIFIFAGCDLFNTNDSYTIGDRGPANGIIFYDNDADNDTGNADGLDSETAGWRYLEAAPYDMQQYNNEPVLNHFEDTDYGFDFGYYRTSDEGNNLYVNGNTSYSSTTCTKTSIGEGETNTELLITAMGDTAYQQATGPNGNSLYAAKLCIDLEYGGFDDWFLPSKDELAAMEDQKAFIPNISESVNWIYYWSSSESNTSSEGSRVIHFIDGEESEGDRGDSLPVRSVRRF